MKKKNIPFLPAPFVKRLSWFFVLCAAVYLFRNWFNIQYYHAVVTVYNGYQIFLVYPLFGLFAFFFRDRIKAIQHYPFRAGWTALFSLIAIVVLFIPFSVLDSLQLGTILTYFVCLYIVYACLFLAIFGSSFARAFAKELMLFANVSLVFLLCSYLLDLYWRSFSFVILRALAFILPFFAKGAVINETDLSVAANGFRVIVGAPCAGVYSMFLFVVFFLLSLYFLTRTKKIHVGRAVIVFFTAILVLFALNIVRVALIVLIGAYYSPEIAISIFHEYAASIIFIGFLFVYLTYIMPLLIKKDDEEKTKSKSEKVKK